jgi:hypothetical protein
MKRVIRFASRQFLVDISYSRHLLQMDRSVAVGWTLCATARKPCIMNLEGISKWWIVHAKPTTRLLEQSKSSFTVTAAKVENKEELFIRAKEETGCFRT